jgi:IPT/TIG domain
LMVGPLEEGFGFLDTTQSQTGPPGLGFLNDYLNPATGPTSGGTVTSLGDLTGKAGQAYFGNSLAALGPPDNQGQVSAITPPGQPGPADVYMFQSDGEMELIPEGFSYGPTILEVSPNYSTGEGGGTGVIYGYGFGQIGATQIPSNLSVTVGGQPATIIGFNWNSYGAASPPFLLQSIYYTIPPGAAGSTADVTITAGSGTTTTTGAMTYLPALEQFPLAGSSLMQGIYDPLRDVYYFTDTNRIQVFSLPQRAWLNPITIPAPQGTTQSLRGIALSADASKLAVADYQAGVVYLLNPANPASVRTFPIKPTTTSQAVLPTGIAVGNTGIVYLAVDVPGYEGGSHVFFTLDTNSGQLADLGLGAPPGLLRDKYLRVSLSNDDSRVFFNMDGYVFGIDTTTGAKFASFYQGIGDYDLALAPNQAQVEATSYLFDSSLNAAAAFAMNDRERLDVTYVYGNKFSPRGGLLFRPATSGLDVYDGRLGTFRSRIAFPLSLSTNYDALVSDGKDNVLIAITGATGDGIAVVDLRSIVEPPPLHYGNGCVSGGTEDVDHREAEAQNKATGRSRGTVCPVHGRPR